MTSRRKFKNRVLAWVFTLGMALYDRLLYVWREPLAVVVAWLARQLARKETRLARTQLRLALGATHRQSVDIVRDISLHLAHSLLETLELVRRPEEMLNRVEWTKEALEAFAQALSHKHGAILVTGHIGNWELLSAAVAAKFSPCGTFYKPSYDPAVDRLIVDSRERHGMKCIARNEPQHAEKTREILRQNGIVAVLIDQSTSVASVKVPFFSLPASTPSGAAALTAKYHCPMVVCWIEHCENRHVVHAAKPLEIPSMASEDLRRTTHDATKLLERAIRRHPEQWVWFHSRWS